MTDETTLAKPPVNSLDGKPAPSISDVSAAVAEYVRLINNFNKIKTAFDNMLEPHKKAADKAESRLAAVMKAAGLKSLDALVDVEPATDDPSTTSGLFRAEFVLKQAPKVEDWDSFYAWIRENNRFDMLHKRVSSAPVVELFQCKEPLPDGVTVTEWDEIKVSAIKAKKPRKAA